MGYYDSCKITELMGKTLVAVEKIDDDQLLFKTDSGIIYQMFHAQD